MNQTSKPTTGFNKNIHGLRGFAAFAVLVYHLHRGAITAGMGHIGGGRDFWPDDVVHQALAVVIDSLNAGIEIFFMISGYLITSTLIRHRNVRRFLSNRILRIYPVFLATQVLMFTVGPIVGWSWMKSISLTEYLKHLVSNVLFLPGVFDLPLALPAAWTLSYEALFYAVSAIAFLLSRRTHRVFVLVLLAVVAIFVARWYPRGVYFFVGTAVYFFHVGLKRNGNEPTSVSWLAVVWFVGLHYLLAQNFDVSDRIRYTFTTAVGFMFFHDIVIGCGCVSWILRRPVFQFLGTISYSLYLWQVPIMYVIKRLLLKFVPIENDLATFYLFAICSIVATVAFAWLSFRILEDVVPKWIRRQMSKQDAAPSS